MSLSKDQTIIEVKLGGCRLAENLDRKTLLASPRLPGNGMTEASNRHARAPRVPRVLLAAAMLLVLFATARAEQDFLNRDGPVSPAYPYPDSDGGPEAAGPGATEPAYRTLVAGPTFRNDKDQTEAGLGFGYVSRGHGFVPFQVSVEPTWLRVKQVERDRNFRKIRLGAKAQLWSRTGGVGGTAVALIGSFSNQDGISSKTELGGALTQLVGERLSLSVNVDWAREYLRSGPTLDTAVAAFGTSYYVGAGVRSGGFYQLYNRIDADDDWGMYLSYAFLPFAEVVVEGGKNQTILAKILVSYALDS